MSVALIVGAAATLLVSVAEILHARRVRRVGRLAFGPRGRARDWVLLAAPTRVMGAGLLVWGLTTLYLIDPQFRRPKEVPDAALKRIVIALDVSPSMELSDAGDKMDQMRRSRAAQVLMSVMDRVSLEQARVTVVAFYTGAKPVVIDTRDPAVVKNIVNDLPLDYAFENGKTAILDGIEEAFKIAKPWREKSATLLVVSDGDTVPYSGMPAAPPSIGRVIVIGVGDAHVGKFIDGHMSRQDAVALRQVAARLNGAYYDANDRNVPTQLISELSGLMPLKEESRAGRREAAIAAVALGGSAVAAVPIALALFGTSWRPGRRTEIDQRPIPTFPSAAKPNPVPLLPTAPLSARRRIPEGAAHA
jgi:Ca-activated chloride channel family protein